MNINEIRVKKSSHLALDDVIYSYFILKGK